MISFNGHKGSPHEVMRNERWLDGEVAVLIVRGYSPLAANWRMRIRGDTRRLTRPGRNAMQEDAFSEKEVAGPSTPDGTAPRATEASTRSQDGGNAKERKDKEGVTVLQFPAFLLPPTPESPPPRRGPLSWAYWAGRRRGSG